MTLRDLLKKKDKIQEDEYTHHPDIDGHKLPQASDFTFLRTDTNTQDIIKPPSFAGDDDPSPQSNQHPTLSPYGKESSSPPKKRFSRLRGLSQSSTTSNDTSSTPKEHKRLSERLHFGHHRASSANSTNLPSDLPEIREPYNDASARDLTHNAGNNDVPDEQTVEKQVDKEAKWEERATLLASTQPRNRSPSPSSLLSSGPQDSSAPGSRPRSISDANSDINIQEAIRLHEAGQLEEAAAMFHTLADKGNVLSQVLYGLSLRHGWGCQVNLPLAVRYLSSAAQNSAAIESEALQAGMKKGGAAKGELVLAIFELGNCFRYGWGVSVDKVAARQYYETAANLGDTDAMNEAAWCYLEGFGGKKDKFRAAQLLRLAEKHGSKTLGNTWIWKEKYDAKSTG